MPTTPDSLINTSAADCAVSIMRTAYTDPIYTLHLIADTLQLLNDRGLEKKSHRQALLKAGRAALKELNG